MKKVLTFGVFDYFHLGHLRLFKNCRKHGDYLIVAVQNGDYIKNYKPEAEVLYSTEERVEILEAIRIVDKVVVYDTVCVGSVKMIDFDVLALGEDHIGERFDEIVNWCHINGKEVVQLKRTQGISSSSIKACINKDLKTL